MKNNKRLKSFTLVEILIASLIFITVLMIVAASFALIKKSNDKTDDSRLADTCSRQLEDYLKARIVSSNNGGRIMALTDTGGFKLVPPLKVNAANIIGFASFVEDGKYEIILKDNANLQYRVFERNYSGQYNFTLEHALSGLDPSGGRAVASSECRTMPSSNAKPFIINISARFPKTMPTATAFSLSEIADLVYGIRLEDTFFRHLGASADFAAEAQAADEKKTTSRVMLDVTNSISSL